MRIKDYINTNSRQDNYVVFFCVNCKHEFKNNIERRYHECPDLGPDNQNGQLVTGKSVHRVFFVKKIYND